jgi:hypothetical protein
LSYCEQVEAKKEPEVLTQAVTKNELGKFEKNEAERRRERLVHERKYHEAEYMRVNLGENELQAKKIWEQRKLKVPEEWD